MSAIKTILIADLVMSLDNVIAVAAAAQGSVVLLVLGLAISIPLVIFAPRCWSSYGSLSGHHHHRRRADRLGRRRNDGDRSRAEGLAGPAGHRVQGDKPYIGDFSLEIIGGIVGVIIVVAVGTWLGKKKGRRGRGDAEG